VPTSLSILRAVALCDIHCSIVSCGAATSSTKYFFEMSSTDQPSASVAAMIAPVEVPGDQIEIVGQTECRIVAMSLPQLAFDTLQNAEREDAAPSTAIEREDAFGTPRIEVVVECSFRVRHVSLPKQRCASPYLMYGHEILGPRRAIGCTRFAGYDSILDRF